MNRNHHDNTKGNDMNTNQDDRTKAIWQHGHKIGHNTSRPADTAWVERLAAALANCDDGQREALVRGFWSGIEQGEDEASCFRHYAEMDRVRDSAFGSVDVDLDWLTV